MLLLHLFRLLFLRGLQTQLYRLLYQIIFCRLPTNVTLKFFVVIALRLHCPHQGIAVGHTFIISILIALHWGRLLRKFIGLLKMLHLEKIRDVGLNVSLLLFLFRLLLLLFAFRHVLDKLINLLIVFHFLAFLFLLGLLFLLFDIAIVLNPKPIKLFVLMIVTCLFFLHLLIRYKLFLWTFMFLQLSQSTFGFLYLFRYAINDKFRQILLRWLLFLQLVRLCWFTFRHRFMLKSKTISVY